MKQQRGSVVKAMDLHPANLGSTPAGAYMCHWWQHERHPAKIVPMRQQRSYLGTSVPW